MRFGPITLLAAGAMLLAACSSSSPDAASTGGPDGSTSSTAAATTESTGTTDELFVVAAGSGSTSAAEGTSLTVTFDDVSEVRTFSDRPVRDAGTETLESFVAGWADEGFTDDPPNAAISTTTAEGSRAIEVVELSDPQSSGTSVTFTAEVVGDPSPALAGLGSASAEALPDSFGATSVFIDGGTSASVVTIYVDMTIGTAVNGSIMFADTLKPAPGFTVQVGETSATPASFTAQMRGQTFTFSAGNSPQDMMVGIVFDLVIPEGADLSGTADVPVGEGKLGVQLATSKTDGFTNLESGPFSIPQS